MQYIYNNEQASTLNFATKVEIKEKMMNMEEKERRLLVC